MFLSESSRKLTLPSEPKENAFITLRFPKKLWKIVNECRTGAITWSADGTAVVIDYSKFQPEYLDNKADMFKTSNITSFVRQLNLYGFRKISPHYRIPDNADIHIFRHDYFVRGRPDLLQKVTRKMASLRERMILQKDKPGRQPSTSHVSRAAQCRLALREALSKQREDRSSHLSSSSSSGREIPQHISAEGSSINTEYGSSMYWEELHRNQTDYYSDSCSSSSSSSSTQGDYIGTEEEGENWTQIPKVPETNVTKVVGCTPTVGTVSVTDVSHVMDPSVLPTSTCGHPDASVSSLEDTFVLPSVLNRPDASLSQKIYYVLMTGKNPFEDDDQREASERASLHESTAETSDKV